MGREEREREEMEREERGDWQIKRLSEHGEERKEENVTNSLGMESHGGTDEWKTYFPMPMTLNTYSSLPMDCLEALPWWDREDEWAGEREGGEGVGGGGYVCFDESGDLE